MAKRLKVAPENSIPSFKLRPLPACIRMAVASGMLMGAVTPAQAELPIPEQVLNSMGVNESLHYSGNTLQIEQSTQNAIYNWKEYNVGEHNKVEYDQPNSSSIALNRIFQGTPSQILGEISSNGQVYLYNQNGFVFGKDSVVNVNTLVASSLAISDEVLTAGLTKQNTTSLDKPALGGSDTLAGSAIVVEKGAKITATGDTNNDGLVVMAAPTVTNKGSIATNEFGQVIMVASQDRVYLQPSQSSQFKGLLVEVQTGGKVTNAGDILTRQGNITLEGFAVNQGGTLTATTSVNVNGSIRLLAQENAAIGSTKIYATSTTRAADNGDGLGTQSSVTFDSGSVTQIVADTASTDTAIDGKVQAQSYMEVVGNQIHMKANSEIVAPYAQINMLATNNVANDVDSTKADFTIVHNVAPTDNPNKSRILVDTNATIDVSGIQHVQVAMERNVGQVSVQTFDLRDSPFQKGGVLQGQTVLVDVRDKTPIVDTSGAVNGIGRTVQERMTQGGTVNLTSNGDVVLNTGSVVNIAGGSVDYQSGYINTTKLVTDYGAIVDISNADPNQHYISIFGVVTEAHSKWGVTTNWTNSPIFGQGQYEAGYTEGKSAGSLNIETPLLSWNADLVAGSTAGRYQRDFTDTPFGGAFIINTDDTAAGRVSAQDVVFQKDASSAALSMADAFPTDADGKATALTLSDALLNASGVEKVLVKTSGNIKIAANAEIDKQGADISLKGGSIDVYGSIHAAGGSIVMATDSVNNTSGKTAELTVGGSAKLNVSGLWIDDYRTWFDNSSALSDGPFQPLYIDAGKVSLTASGGDLTVAAGSAIRADGGALLSVDNVVTGGKGGAISLAALPDINGKASAVHLYGHLSAWGLAEGGSLNLSSGKIVIGTVDTNDINNGGNAPLILTTDYVNGLLQHSGFSDLTLTSNSDSLTLSGGSSLKFQGADYAQVLLVAKNRVVNDLTFHPASRDFITALTHLETLPEQLRNPVNLSLKALSGIAIEKGSEIIGDTGAAINLATTTKGIYVDGTIAAPAGSINLTLAADTQLTVYDASQAIWLGSEAQLLAKGATRLNPVNGLNVHSGEVLDGGTVTLTANEGYVIQEKGALIDVSGTQAVLDVPKIDQVTSATIYEPTTIASNAGAIKISAGEGIDLEGVIQGNAGSSSTKAGRLDVTIDSSLRSIDTSGSGVSLVFPQNEKIIQITQHTGSVLGDLKYGDKLDSYDPNSPALDKSSLNGKARISSDLIENGGFSDVRLKSNASVVVDGAAAIRSDIRFVGAVNLTAKDRLELTSQKVSWEAAYTAQGISEGSEGNAVNLNSAYFKAGWDTWLSKPDTSALTVGDGKLSVHSQWTDLVGYLSMDGLAQVNLNSRHELRTTGNFDSDPASATKYEYIGFLRTAANLNLTASQIYPSTLTKYTFSVDSTLNPEGAIRISGNAYKDATPLSANGELSFEAANIHQNGILRAPFGSINLTAGTTLSLGPKSITSVSADGKTIPFGNTLGGLYWTYILNNNQNVVYDDASQGYLSIQSKKINLSSPDVALAKGSTVDIAGGGDLYAYEFIKGAGGSADYLLPGSDAYQGGFAIVPSQGKASLSPVDPHEQTLLGVLSEQEQERYTAGSQIYLSGAEGLPAGTYTIMPAHYALLPGAYLVTPQANSQDLSVSTHNTAGQEIIAGYYTNSVTGTHDSRTSGFLIESGADVRKHSQYTESSANSFFTALAATNGTSVPLIPKDSGQVAIDVANQLLIEGSINSAAASDKNGVGRGGKLDITSANGITVVADSGSSASGVRIKASDLNNLNLDSLLLGGIRSRDNATGETDLLVTTRKVDIASGVDLTVKDLVLAATDKVVVESGAVLKAGEAVNTGDTVYKVTGLSQAPDPKHPGQTVDVAGYGALLRVSSDKQVSLSADSVLNTSSTASGDLVIKSGATITGITDGNSTSLASVLLDSSKATHLSSAANILMHGGSLSLNANTINIGEVGKGAVANALSLNNLQLTNLVVDELLLNSRHTINFYGDVGQTDSTGQLLKNADGSLVALKFGALTVNAAGLAGFGGKDNTVKLQADTLAVGNSTGAKSSLGAGSGKLELLTDDYTQAAGAFAMRGFNSVTITPLNGTKNASQFHIDGTGSLTVAGDLHVTSDYLTATGGADLTIKALGHTVSFANAGQTDTSMASGFGATLNIAANSVDFNTNALLYSGKLALQAKTGDVTVGEQADIHLEGKAVQFADVIKYTPGGIFSAVADTGKITLSAGSNVNMDTGGGGAAGGQLILKAPTQTIDLLGTLSANSGSTIIELAKFDAAANFDQWTAKLNDIGISGSVYFRSTEDALVQQAGNTLTAASVTLVSDQKGIDLAGTVNTANANGGGAIALYAGDKVTLESTAVLNTKGATGGDVLLSSVDSDKDGVSGISIKSGAAIDVSGSTAAQGGDVTLRALRDTGSIIKIDPVAANTVQGAKHFYAEGVQQYTNADIANGVIDSTVIAAIQADTSAYMSATNMAQVANLIHGATLRPGVEIDYDGALTVQDTWDFATWRYGNDVAGNLVINASGKLTVANSITDGYVQQSNAILGFIDLGNGELGDPYVLQAGNSWSYQLAAGADLGSADNFATINNAAHSLDIAGHKDHPVTIRTGVGDIKLAAGGDIIFENKYGNSTVYTGGTLSDTNPYGSLDNGSPDASLLSNPAYANLAAADYGVNGGDIVMATENNIVNQLDLSKPNNQQFLTNWLVRVGDWGSVASTKIATAWGVNVNNFHQNVGSFGGGNVTINAGKNISDLSVMMPSTGKQVGKITGFADDGVTPVFANNAVEIGGGGQMAIHAGGNVAGGAYLLGKGIGSISADGEITGGKQFVNGPQLVMGDSTLALEAKRGISVTAVSDQMSISPDTQFYTYTDTSSLTANALSGDVYLGADTSIIANYLNLTTVVQNTSAVYPVNLASTAFGGSIKLDTVKLFPASSSTVSLLAQQNIMSNKSKLTDGLVMLDIDKSKLPSALLPFLLADDFSGLFTVPAVPGSTTVPSSTGLLHKNDLQPARLVTQEGDIKDIQVVLSKQSIIQAGRDLTNVKLDIQNINSTDSTVLAAGRDIVQPTLLSSIGALNLSNAATTFIRVTGPGDVLVKTGRNLDLGISKGIITSGNELNTNLSSTGADITVLAGLNGHDLNYTGFISSYLSAYPSDNNYASVSTLITNYMRQHLNDSTLSTADALKLFKNLDVADYAAIQTQLTALILPVYQNHSNLSYQGVSNADVIAALSDSASSKYNAMVDKYLQHFAVAEQFNSATATITAFMQERTGNTELTAAQALTLFKDLGSNDYVTIQQKLNNALLPVYYNEINEAGSASAVDKTLGNDRAYTAINTLFPGSELKTADAAYPWKGDVNMAFSTIQTDEGGDVNLLVPGGKTTVGLSFAFPGLEGKASSDLGIIAQQAGDINVFTRGDFAVNLSRVFAQSGGNVGIWSTEGNIDAGRGAKTALTIPETNVSYSSSGKLTVVKPAVSGSGIRAAASLKSKSGQGNVALFAPGGVVNAGEAGIGGKNVTISATAVLGANNIQVGPGGTGTGVPSASVGSLAAGLTGVSNSTANVSQMAQATAESNENDNDKKRKNKKLGVLSVDFIGHGDESKNKIRPAS
ncbi:filamentous hemagglutinin family protein [Methylovulum psychrotolerans]|uniref:filamentous haemagglutinin family protein n=1 Tax=Methylovulum psychrotolerans TaxID=1704499 RepID=UPI001BFEEDBA|nr:filamentous haemagglutinin family protein [Methylovulum psychrotolerans]MBT9097410.1 filamentous hemagglutinin family protein [Methylovulum psychrotolerans]